MRLQPLVGSAAVGVALLILGSTGALIDITTVMHRSSHEIAATLQSVRAAEELQANLARSNRASLLHAMTAAPEYARERNDAEGAVQRSLTVARRLVGDDQEATALREVESRLDAYRRVRAADQARGVSPLEGYRDSQPAVDAATTAIDRFVDENFRQALDAKARAEQWDRRVDILALAMAVLLVAIPVAALLMLRRLVVRPLLGLRAVVHRHGQGDRTVRAALDGVDDVREIAVAINVASDALDRQREVQLQFLAGVAHDLRNPLAALKLSATIQRSARPQDGESELTRLREIVVRQVNQLDRMVGDLLDASRIEAGRLQLKFERCDARDLVRATVGLFESVSAKHELRVSVPDAPVHVHGDAARIEQVLNNLVSNAIKYSPRGGCVDVTALAVDDGVCIEVSDEGIGIAKADRELIFEPFRRTATTRETIPGVGLGLSVARRIVLAHGGRMTVTSAEGTGTTFSVWLPAAAPQASARSSGV